MTKRLQFNARARYSIKKGVDTLTNAVKVTIGPRGRNVVLDKPFETPNILNDGVIIARDIDLEEPFANMGVQLVKEAAIRTNDMAGDGSTTATILAQAILAEGLKNIAAGADPLLFPNRFGPWGEGFGGESKAQSQNNRKHRRNGQAAPKTPRGPHIWGKNA